MYPYFDRLPSGCTEPVSVGTEDKSVDNFSSRQSVKVFSFIQVPQHCIAILKQYNVFDNIQVQKRLLFIDSQSFID